MTSKTNYKPTIIAAYVGYIVQAIVNNYVTLLFVNFHTEFDIPFSKITLLITLNFVSQLLFDFLAAFFVDKIGYRVTVVAAHIFSAAGLIGMAFLPSVMPPFYGLLVSSVIYAMGGGLIEVVVSPIIEACPSDDKAGSMSLLHSFYCWGVVGVILVSTAFFALFGIENWRILACIWAAVPLVNAVAFMFVPIRTLTEKGESMSLGELGKTGIFWVFIMLMLASGASELSMSQWASALTESSLGVSKTVGDLLGACMFSVFMGATRVFYSKMSEKIRLENFLMFSGILCAATYIITAFSPLPWLSLVGCALCGIAVGLMWPGVYSMASARFPKGGTAMFAILALAGDLGCSTGPTSVGFLSGLFGDDLKKGLSFGLIFPLLMIFGLLLLKKEKKKR